MAAKLCYSASDIEHIREGLDEENTSKFIDMLSNMGHGSPFEHASFTFGIEGISRACSHQLVRHRIASYSQQSQRYVDGTKFEFVTPPEIEKNEKAYSAYKKVIDMQSEAYREIRDALVVGYIREGYGDKYQGSDEEIIESFKADNKGVFSGYLKKALTPAPQRLSAHLTPEALRTSLLTAAATALSGKSARSLSRCCLSASRLLLTFSQSADRPACSDPVPRAECHAARQRK